MVERVEIGPVPLAMAWMLRTTTEIGSADTAVGGLSGHGHSHLDTVRLYLKSGAWDDRSQEVLRRVRAACSRPAPVGWPSCRRRATCSSATASGRRRSPRSPRTPGVSAESVYKGFGTKAALAKAVFDLVLAGDDEPVPIADGRPSRRYGTSPTSGARSRMFVGGLAQRQARSAPVQILIRDGRHVDDSLNPVWATLHDEGLTGMTALGRHLLDTGQLRAGDLEQVRDVLWNYLAIDPYERLVLIQGSLAASIRTGWRTPWSARCSDSSTLD